MQSELVDTSMGDIELNVGSWVSMLERASDVQAIYIGKPNPFAFELSLQTMKLAPQEVVVVGDRMSTDIAGAYMFGLRSVLVKTGEFNPDDLNTNVHPDSIVDSVRVVPGILKDW
jgi:phospholysine phosphohistidine inorganic pyrophosphate phosphatase